MLTADLVRVSLRGGKVHPRYIDASNESLLDSAARLIAIFGEYQGHRLGDLDEAIADHIGDSPDFMLQKGLVKLLKDRGTFEVSSPRPPTEIREAVFRQAADHWPVGQRAPLTSRDQVIGDAAAALGLSVEEVETHLYGDLKAEERLIEITLPTPEALLHRYNLALAQGVVLKAREITIHLPGVEAKRARQLFRIIKFHRLMHRAKRTKKGYEITLDGPLSLFRQTHRYGLQLALLLPSLCHAERWLMEATVQWGDERREFGFSVSHESGLETHTRDKGTWKSDEEKHFERLFKKKGGDWSIRRGAKVVDLDGRGVLVPDYVLTHRDGRVALLDIVWFWKKQGFKRHIELLAQVGPQNLIVAVATRLNTDEMIPELDPTRVYPFKGVIHPARIVELAEIHASG